MKEIFDFELIKNLISGVGQNPLKVLINAMHGGKSNFSYQNKVNEQTALNIAFPIFSHWSLRQPYILRGVGS